MSKIYKFLLATVIVSTISFTVSAQNDYWTSRSEKSGITTDKALARQSFPTEFKLFTLSIESLRQKLFTITNNESRTSTTISLPNANGILEQFEVYEASNFEPELQARFPEIRAFSGKGITDRSARLKLSISPQGIQTMIFRTESKNEFIEPYSQDHKVYAVYSSQRAPGQLPWTCSTDDQAMFNSLNTNITSSNVIESNTGQLKTMRLAQSVTAEYSNWFGAFNASQVSLVLAAVNATLTRCNGVYENDLALHLNLIPNTTDVFYYDIATDPYTFPISNWNTQLQNTLTSVIGEANYDIGHLFGQSGGGGNAGCIGCVCVDGIKGRGITSPSDGIPMGDNFDIDYVAHEVGHQLGANHTFSMSNEGTGVNKEVGSGITIMGYAGITNQDVAPHSIDIFHQASIQQIQVNLVSKSCPITTVITANNATPVVSVISPFTIPISTPFALTGFASDANPGDVLTYCWEQDDNGTGQTGNNSVAYPTKPTGPNWLTFPAVTTGTRLFPKLSTILAGLSITPVLPGGDAIANIEALSSVSRTLNFRLTVRDNSPYVPGTKVGQTAFTDVAITVNASGGPFLITSQNTATTWVGGGTEPINWSVNNTTAAPFNVANVKISFSSDGGNTFSTLIASTPNDGTENISVPVITTSTGRIKVEAIGNIFFDINNANITVAPPPNGFTFNSPVAVIATCPAPNIMTSGNLTATYQGTFTGNINLNGTVSPAGPAVSFSNSTLTTTSPSSTVTLTGMAGLSPGNYVVTVTGVGVGVPNVTRDITFTINPGSGPAITAQPSVQIICSGSSASFSITSPSATSFQWQLSTDGGANYNNIFNGGVYSGATTTTLTITGATAGLNNNRYRCIASALCGSTTSSGGILTVNTAPAFSTNPSNITLCVGSNHTFSVSVTGSNPTFQWQLSTDGGVIYNPLTNGGVYSGVTTNSLTLTGITAGMDTYRYRCVVSGTCSPSATSTGAILTVNTTVAVTSQPANTPVCEGSNTSFTVGGSGSGIIYQWQVSTDGGANYINLSNGGVYSGVTTATLIITGATFSLNNNRYRCLLTNPTCTTPGISNGAILTVNTLPQVTTQPQSVTICLGSNTSFTTAATGTGIGYQWQVSTDGGTNYSNIVNGGVYSGATTVTLTITGATAAMNTNRYRNVVTGTCPPPATTNAAILTVINPVSISSSPVASVICSGSNTSFTVVGSSTQTIIYQWQVSTDGGTNFTNISNGGVYSGATTATLTITGATTSLNTYHYRCNLSNATCTVPTASGNALLTVRQLPTITLAAAPLTTLLPGQTTTLTATPSASTGGVLTTTWLYNGAAPVPAISGNIYIANVEKLGTYQVLISETFTGPALVCSNQSAIVTITASASNKLFIFPSPNDGRFTVSYYNNGGTSTKRMISIFDSKGANVYNAEFSISGLYTLLPINLEKVGRGIYYVVIGDANSMKLAEGKVHIR